MMFLSIPHSNLVNGQNEEQVCASQLLIRFDVWFSERMLHYFSSPSDQVDDTALFSNQCIADGIAALNVPEHTFQLLQQADQDT